MEDTNLLFLSEVVRRTRLSHTTIWRLERLGRFPRRLRIGVKRVAWREDEIRQWLADRTAERAA